MIKILNNCKVKELTSWNGYAIDPQYVSTTWPGVLILGHSITQISHCMKSHRKNNVHLLGELILFSYYFFNFNRSIKLRETWHIINLNAKFTFISAVKLGICQKLGSPGSRYWNTDEHAGYLLKSVFESTWGEEKGKKKDWVKGELGLW